MAWFFTALDLSLTFVRQLQAQADVFVKRWAGLPRPASTAILFSGRFERAGLKITARNILEANASRAHGHLKTF